MAGLIRLLLGFALSFWAGIAGADEQRVAIPNYWEPRMRLAKPDTSSLRVVRFLTDDEYPPLHFSDADGVLTGFSVDLARSVCEKLMLACTIQARRFDTLLDSLAEGRGDVVAAAISMTPDLRKRFSATATYLRSPARFVTLAQSALPELFPETLAGKRVGVVGGTAHEAFLLRYMPASQRRATQDLNAALLALRDREVDYVFGDGLALAIWLGGRAGSGHAFAGQPYLESRYFGEGIGFILRPEDVVLKRALDYALQLLWDDGTYARLYLRYFPVSLY